MKAKALYVLYDERGILGDTDDATVLNSWSGGEYGTEEVILKEAKKFIRSNRISGVLCSYEFTNNPKVKNEVSGEVKIAFFNFGRDMEVPT